MTTGTKQLKKELNEAEQELRLLEQRLEHRPDFGHGKGGARGHDWQMALARRQHTEERIRRLRRALGRIEDGSYGLCRSCGQQIDPDRLHILPATTFCVRCKRVQSESSTVDSAYAQAIAPH